MDLDKSTGKEKEWSVGTRTESDDVGNEFPELDRPNRIDSFRDQPHSSSSWFFSLFLLLFLAHSMALYLGENP